MLTEEEGQQERGDPSGASEKDYWRGKYEEAARARQELVELMKQLITQNQVRPSPSPSAIPPANMLAGKPINFQMGNILGVLPPVLMFIFGLYGTATGADIGTAMIIIGGIFAVIFALYLFTRVRPSMVAAPQESSGSGAGGDTGSPPRS